MLLQEFPEAHCSNITFVRIYMYAFVGICVSQCVSFSVWHFQQASHKGHNDRPRRKWYTQQNGSCLEM